MQVPQAICSDSFYFEGDKSETVLIMGLGNYLMGDEGVGIQTIQQLSELDLGDRIDILDGGTGGFLLLNYFETYRQIILVDATMDGKPPGTISLIKPRFASDYPPSLSVHDVGLKDMIEAVYLLDNVPEIYLFTISILEITPMTTDLSSEVERTIPLLKDRIIALANDLIAVCKA